MAFRNLRIPGRTLESELRFESGPQLLRRGQRTFVQIPSVRIEWMLTRTGLKTQLMGHCHPQEWKKELRQTQTSAKLQPSGTTGQTCQTLPDFHFWYGDIMTLPTPEIRSIEPSLGRWTSCCSHWVLTLCACQLVAAKEVK
jgi:hypothetical protein